MTISELQGRAHAQGDDLGWNDRPIPIPEMVALIHSEASEALESYRNNEPIAWTDDAGKPQGIASEFADILIRVAHYASLLRIDLELEVERKLNFNRTRGYRHGGKKA